MISLLIGVNVVTCVLLVIPIVCLMRLVKGNKGVARKLIEEKGASMKSEHALRCEVEELHLLIGFPPRFALVPPSEHPYRVAPELVPRLAPLEIRKEQEVIKQWQKWRDYVRLWNEEARKVADRTDGWTLRRVRGDEALQHTYRERQIEAMLEFKRYDRMAREMEIPVDLLQASWEDEEDRSEAN